MDETLIFERYYNLALRFLSYRPRSEKEIYDYLSKKFKTQKSKFKIESQNEKIIARIMSKLIEQKFIDDRQFAKFWIEHRKKGFKFVKLELLQKGVSKEIIEQVASEFDLTAKESSLIEKLIEKKTKALQNTPSQKAYEKMVAFLLRKGFDYETIKKSLSKS